MSYETSDKEIKAPMKYHLRLESGRPLRLQFENYRMFSHFETELSGCQYTFNGKKYAGVSCLNVKETEKLTDDISISEDIYGSKVLRINTDIPAFDSGDWEWDSYRTEYLMSDGKDIHLIVVRGGYQIASLALYTRLVAADVRVKPYFERLGFAVDQGLFFSAEVDTET